MFLDYTEDGIWDMTGNNTPVFFIRDPSKFPDFIHTQLKTFSFFRLSLSLSVSLSLHKITTTKN